MAFARSILIAGMIALSCRGAHAEEAARAIALSSCPRDLQTSCIEMTMHWDFARADKPPFVAAGSGASDGNAARLLAVRGRLGGDDTRAFELVVSAAKRMRGNYIGEVAYLGRSPEGRPTIVTDKGPLAFDTRGLHVGRADAVVIVDEREKKTVRSFLGGLDGGTYVVHGAERIGALSRSGACLSPPESRPGALTAVTQCGEPLGWTDGLDFSENISGTVAIAPDADLAMIRKLLPQTSELSDEQLRAKVGRIGPHHVVVTPWGAAE